MIAISPLDGRYKEKTEILGKYFSEFSLVSTRIKVEIEYLILLAKFKVIRKFTKKELNFLNKLSKISELDFEIIKKFENETHHDVKAVEYYIRSKFAKTSLDDIIPFIHIAITSADINNLSYRIMTQNSLDYVLKNLMLKVLASLNKLSKKYSALPMLARTHGQAAIPTTLGKELMVFSLRLMDILVELKSFKLKAKFNGAVGGYQAMSLVFPNINWPKFSNEFVRSYGFEFAELTTQIAPADDLVKLFSILHRFNSVLIDLNQDLWRYISDGWLIQKKKNKYVGSSTMPQKINPIEFENSEGNLSLANSLFEGFIRKLPISRLQRDLSESTVVRNIGTAFGFCLLAYSSLNSGLEKLSVDRKKINDSLSENYNILLEAWQTQARKDGNKDAYETAAKLGKNKHFSAIDWSNLVKGSDLAKLTPINYLGLSSRLTDKNAKKINKFLSNYRRD